MSEFRFSYGPAGQPSGLIEATETAYLLHGAKTLYVIERGPGTDLEHGYITIADAETGMQVVSKAGLGIRTSSGTKGQAGPAKTAVATRSPDGTELVVAYTDSISGVMRQRTHTFTVEGNAVSVVVQATGPNQTELESNYSGLYGGMFDPALDLKPLEIPGALATPIAAYIDPVTGAPRFGGHVIDITRSNASSFALPDPKASASATTWSYSTAWRYDKNTAGVLQAGLHEVLLAVVSDDIEDCFIHPSEGSTQIERLAHMPWTFITSRAKTWDHFAAYLDKRAELGMDRGTIYSQFFWQEINYPDDVIQNNGQCWYPAGDAPGFAALCAKARAMGLSTGGYTLWAIQKEGVPDYTAAHRVLNADGTPRHSVWEQGVWLGKEEMTPHYMDLYLPKVRDVYDWDMMRYDVATQGSPLTGNGNNVDSEAGSPCGTLRGAIAVRRAWMAYGKAVLGPDAFVYGEGSRVTHLSDLELLWSRVVDGTHKDINTNSGKDESSITDSSRTISNTPLVLNHEWSVTALYRANTGSNPARFFSPEDVVLQDPGVKGLYPYSRRMNDRRRAYAVMLGQPGAIPVNGAGFEHFMTMKEQVKEFYMLNTITAAMRDLTVPEISYHSDTHGFETFAQRYARLGLDGFRHAQIRLRFKSGYQALVNRSSTDWVLPNTLGGVTLPTDGFICFGTVKGVSIFGGSCAATITGGKRVDFVLVPGELLMADGRGEVTNFLGMDLPGAGLALRDLDRGFQLMERADGSIERVEGLDLV